MSTLRPPSSRNGFTLVEILVSVAILAIIAVLIAQMLNSAARITVVNNKHMDANSQARSVFDRMANDFARIVKRNDVDYIFWKAPVVGGAGGNDTMFFYSEGASYFDSADFRLSTTATPGYPLNAVGYSGEKNRVSLVGYRVDNVKTVSGSANPAYYQMERLGKPLSWDSSPTATAKNQDNYWNSKLNTNPNFMVFLTYPYPLYATQAALLADFNMENPTTGNPYSAAYFNSTLAGAFSNQGATGGVVGTESGNFNDGNDAAYHSVGTQVFRMEISFLLRDGTQSSIAITNPSTTTNNLTASGPPYSTSDSNNDDSSGTYAPGSRWYDTTNQIGYICLDASPNAAVWREIGLQDITAVVVTIAVIDSQGLALVKKRGTDMKTVAGAFVDGVNASVAKTWLTAMLPGGTVATKSTLPQSIVSQMRVYQHFFYINNF